MPDNISGYYNNRDLSYTVERAQRAFEESGGLVGGKTPILKQPVEDTIASLDSAIRRLNQEIERLSKLNATAYASEIEQLKRDGDILREKRKVAQKGQEEPIKFQQARVDGFIKSAESLYKSANEYMMSSSR